MKWPTTKEQHAYMKMRQDQNLEACVDVRAEAWMAERLKRTGRSWKRQAQWGYRLFDFWCFELGVALEVDGSTHDPEYDRVRDEYNFNRSGILVIRVRNWNDDDAARALEEIARAGTWNERRQALGLKPIAQATAKP